MVDKPRETPRRPGRARSRRSEPPKAPAVQVHAHRGGGLLAPENTMAAFRGAVALGVHFLEFDVRTCATGEVVVHHDADLSRLVGQPDRIDRLPLRDLQQVDMGSHFAPEFAGEPVPTLVEVLETFRDQVRFNIELKEDGATGDGTADRTGRLIESMNLYGDVIVSSFNPASLWRVRRRCAAPTALVYPMEGGRGISGRLRDRALARPWASAALSTYALHPRETLVTAEFVRKCHLRGLAVNTWTVNDAVRMRELVALRVNGLITDRPDLALKVTADLDPLRRPGAGLPD